MKRSPTQRTLAHLRSLNYTCAVVERWNQWAKVRQDLFGFIDVVCLDDINLRIIGIQVTSQANVSARVKKILAEKRAKLWLQSGGAIEVHGWAKKGTRGKRKTWQLTVRDIPIQHFESTKPCTDNSRG